MRLVNDILRHPADHEPWNVKQEKAQQKGKTLNKLKKGADQLASLEKQLLSLEESSKSEHSQSSSSQSYSASSS